MMAATANDGYGSRHATRTTNSTIVQIFHLTGDVTPAEMRGCLSSGFAHGSCEVEVGGQPAGSRTDRLWVPCNHEAGAGSSHDLGCPYFRRDHYRDAASHGLEHGVTKVF